MPNNEDRKKLLISEIKSGNCVAFIGAGFSAPAVRTWTDLIDKLAQSDQLGSEVKKQVREIIRHESKASNPLFDREAAAELIEADIIANPDADFRKEVREALDRDETEGEEEVNERLKLLKLIPFDSVLTTNFDSKLSGGQAFRKADLEDLLRNRNRNRGWSDGFDIDGNPKSSPVITLHGDIEDPSDDPQSLVFSRSGYRKLLFETPNYQSLIRAVFATKTVVFFGFSFSDAYLNLIRSEVISMLMPHAEEHRKKPFAYAVMDDISEAQVKYLNDREGISAIRYCKENENDHSGFTEILREISEGTNPQNVVKELLEGKKIVWFDEHPENNQQGIEELRKSIPPENIFVENKLEEAKNRLKSEDRVDLLITHWGTKDGSEESNAVSLLKTIKVKNLPIPTLVFASKKCAGKRRTEAIKQGAFDYIYEFPDLYSRIDDLFAEHDDAN